MEYAISVILLSYNRPYYVQQAVNSVLWQTFKDFELMIIENSTDLETRSVLEKYDDPRIKMFYENPTPEERKAECIVSVYNNKYIDIAEGKYIFFFCDDDILLPNCLEEHYKHAEANGSCDNHSGQIWLNYKKGLWSFEKILQWPGEVFDESHSPSCKLTGGAVMFNREHITSSLEQPYFRLNSDHCSTADADFFEKMSKYYPIFPVNMTLSIARFHDNPRSFEWWRYE